MRARCEGAAVELATGARSGWWPRTGARDHRARHRFAGHLRCPVRTHPAADGSPWGNRKRVERSTRERRISGATRSPAPPGECGRSLTRQAKKAVPAPTCSAATSPPAPRSGLVPRLRSGHCGGLREVPLHHLSTYSEVDPERGAGLTASPFLRVASRTRRAPLSAPGSPQVPWVCGHFILCSATVTGYVFPGSSSAWHSPLPDRTAPSRLRRATCRSVGVVPSKEHAGACASAI
ncbi:hypothetical protein NORO109296_13690 [Nocardiopsis rhodophaea]